MIHYIKNYPLSILVVAIIGYLSFFSPPQTSMNEIPYIDKLAHIGMYGGLTVMLWLEYLLKHQTISYGRLIYGGILAPILMSGMVEILQGTCTQHRSGDWLDLVANIIGVCLGALFCFYILKPIIKRYGKRERYK